MGTVNELQEYLIKWGMVDPPVDGVLGAQTLAARKMFANMYSVADTTDAVCATAKVKTPKEINPVNNNVALVIEECQKKGYYLSRGVDAYNIVYIEGVDPDFSPNSNRIDDWNDLRTILIIEHNGRAYFRNIWRATVNTGRPYTNNPMNPGGAANLEPGQYWAWQAGRHITASMNQEALIQVRPVPVRRDANENGRTQDDKVEDWEVIGLNQHGGKGAKVGYYSAGCLVVDSFEVQQDFMDVMYTDRRYKVNKNFVFPTILITNYAFR